MDQVYIFLYAILGGAIVAFLYDVLRIKRRAIKTSVILVSLEDILYWLIAAIILFLIVYKSNSGEMRGYIFIGNVIGVILYEEIFSRIVIGSSMMIINIVKKTVMFIWRILSYPFRVLYKVFALPISFILRQIFKIAKLSSKKVKSIGGKAGGLSKKGINKITRVGIKLRKVKKNK